MLLDTYCEHRCEDCRYWGGEMARAESRNSLSDVYQCLNTSEDGPSSGLGDVLGYVFTPAHAGCDGFEKHPEIAREEQENVEYYQQLSESLFIDAYA